MREIIKDFISVYKNTFLTDIFDDTVIVFADRRRERIDDDLPNLLHELEVRGLLCCVIINDTSETTQDVKHAYWAFQNYKKEISMPCFRTSSKLPRVFVVSALMKLTMVSSRSPL